MGFRGNAVDVKITKSTYDVKYLFTSPMYIKYGRYELVPVISDKNSSNEW